jgi:hypothetical protein
LFDEQPELIGGWQGLRPAQQEGRLHSELPTRTGWVPLVQKLRRGRRHRCISFCEPTCGWGQGRWTTRPDRSFGTIDFFVVPMEPDDRRNALRAVWITGKIMSLSLRISAVSNSCARGTAPAQKTTPMLLNLPYLSAEVGHTLRLLRQQIADYLARAVFLLLVLF